MRYDKRLALRDGAGPSAIARVTQDRSLAGTVAAAQRPRRGPGAWSSFKRKQRMKMSVDSRLWHSFRHRVSCRESMSMRARSAGLSRGNATGGTRPTRLPLRSLSPGPASFLVDEFDAADSKACRITGIVVGSFSMASEEQASVSRQPPKSLWRMLPPLAQNTSVTPISEPPATTPDATGKVNSLASDGLRLSIRSATRAPRKNKSP
jgi:hypothetical protein